MTESSTELFWDHGGETLGETSAFINEIDADSSFHVSRNEGVKLSKYATLKLIQNLEETSDILRAYLTEVENDLEKSETAEKTGVTNSGCKQYVCQKCSSLLQHITGTKTIIFTIVLQGVNLLIQTIIDFLPHKDTYDVLVASGATMILFQLINLVLIIFTSAKLARQMLDQQISGLLLIQSYIATLLLFAGLYTVTKRLKPSSWKYLQEDVKDPTYLAVIYCKFLYLSVSTGTLCGSVDITPDDWYNCVFMSLQMLLSFMYFASILGHACMPKQKTTKDRLNSSLPCPRASSRLPSRSDTPNHLTSRLLTSFNFTNYGSVRDQTQTTESSNPT